MTTYPSALFLAVGDTLTPSGGDYVPASGDYLNVLNPQGILCLEGGLIIPTSKTPADQKVAGTTTRVRQVRSQPIKVLTLHLMLVAGGTDSTTWRRLWASIEHKLEQAAAASGPFGNGNNVCLLVRFATGPQASSLGANFTAFDVVGGVCTQNDLLTNPGQAYGMTLELRCLLHGRLTAQTYPGINTFTSLTNGLTSYWYLGTGTSGPIPGHLGAMAQVHILDTSTGGHAINRITIGRRNVPGLNGGMGSGDWVPILAVNSALGSATTVAGSGVGGISTNVVTQTISDSNWYAMARFTSEISGSTPTYENGLYDVFARVRESVTVAQEMPAPAVATGTGYTSALPPDTYQFAFVGVNAGSTTDLGPTTQWTVPDTWYSAPSNILFEDGFETGDTTYYTQISKTGANTKDNSAGSLTVSTAYAIVGQYGLRSTGQWNYTDQGEYTNATGGGGFQLTAFEQRVIRPFSNPGTDYPLIAGWFKIPWCPPQFNLGFVSIMALESSVLQYFNAQVTFSGTPGPSQSSAYAASGDQGGMIADVGLYQGELVLRTWTTGGVVQYTSLLAGSSFVNQPIWISLMVAASTVQGGHAYTVTALVYYNNTYASVTAGGTLSVGSTYVYPIDTAAWGLRTIGYAGSAEVWIDQVFIGTFPTSTVNVASRPPVITVPSNPNGAYEPFLWIQDGRGTWYQVTSRTYPYTVTAADLAPANIVTPPAVAVPTQSSFQARARIAGSQAVNGPVMQGTLAGNQWYLLYLGTIPLPPASRFEGLNPSGGSGSGDFPWLLDVYAQSGAGTSSNTIQVDTLYLLPQLEPQVQVSFPGLANTTLYEWVIDCRRDGRVGCVLRDTATFSIIEQQCEVIGHMELGPGNQTLVFLVERDGGVHDPTNTSYGVCMRYQPITDFVDDNPTAY